MTRLAIAFTFATVVFSQWAMAKDPPVASFAKDSSERVPENQEIQFGGFLALGKEVQEFRESRRIPVSRFVKMAKEPGTIILDTRSKTAYDDVHIENAIHLNFSDFSDEKLRKTITSKTTRILIYCNNNFTDDSNLSTAASEQGEPTTDNAIPGVVQGFTDKMPTLALNIPTFINLHGYGYQNIYELADRLHISDRRIRLVGKSVHVSEE